MEGRRGGARESVRWTMSTYHRVFVTHEEEEDGVLTSWFYVGLIHSAVVYFLRSGHRKPIFLPGKILLKQSQEPITLTQPS